MGIEDLINKIKKFGSMDGEVVYTENQGANNQVFGPEKQQKVSKTREEAKEEAEYRNVKAKGGKLTDEQRQRLLKDAVNKGLGRR